MNAPLTISWRYASAEIWRPLFARFGDEHPDLPIAVVRSMMDRPRAASPIFIDPGINASLDALREDVATVLDYPDDARMALRKIKPEFFRNEQAIATVISDVAAAFSEYESAALDLAYEDRIRLFIKRHSLPYRLDVVPVRLVPLLSGDIEKMYIGLRARAQTSPDILEALTAFENAWGRQVSDWSQVNAKAAIQTAALLAEQMLVSASESKEREFSKAMAAMRRANSFPSNDFANIFDRAYTFVNVYPNIRHPGNPECVKRELQREDAVLAALVFFGLSACVHNLVEGSALPAKVLE